MQMQVSGVSTYRGLSSSLSIRPRHHKRGSSSPSSTSHQNSAIVWDIIFELLSNLDEDLADMTACRFLRHTTVKAYLQNQFPHSVCPPLSELHSSLANRSHLKAYIIQEKDKHFPFGTGWQGTYLNNFYGVSESYLFLALLGAVHLKSEQDLQLQHNRRYIRRAIEESASNFDQHEEDIASTMETGEMFRMVFCMNEEGS